MDSLSSHPSYTSSKCILVICMISILLDIYHPLLVYKLVSAPFGTMIAASFLVCPLLDDVVTEVYGFKTYMMLFFSTEICKFIFSIICYSLINLHSPYSWQGQSSYNLFFGHLTEIAITILIASMISSYINNRLLFKWKILLKGKYFWIRSVSSSIIGVTIYVFLVIPSLILWSNSVITDSRTLISITAWSWITRLSLIIIFSFPSVVLVNVLKIIDKPNICEYPYFNPFKQKNA